MISEAGYEAIILTIPNAPVSLVETISARTDNSITFTWNAGSADGGAPILDYRINYDQSNDEWIVLDTEITETHYTATQLT